MPTIGDRAAEVVQAFLTCVIAEPGSLEQHQFADAFNALLDRFLDDYQNESVGTVAYRISMLGVPYEQAFNDLMVVRLQWGVDRIKPGNKNGMVNESG